MRYVVIAELSEGFEAAQGEGVEFARRPGDSDEGNHKAAGALEGLQSEWREISDLVSLISTRRRGLSHFFLLFITLLELHVSFSGRVQFEFFFRVGFGFGGVYSNYYFIV